jgi:hypothetical protein
MRASTLRALVLAAAGLFGSGCLADGQDDVLDGVDPSVSDGADRGSDEGSGGGTSEPTEKVLDHDYQIQETGYWCGPAATRVALSARMAPPSQTMLANQLGTTVNGTDWIGQITQVLNNRLGGAYYVTTEMPNDPPTTAQRDELWRDVVLSINADYVVVANIVAPPGNQPPGYPANQTIYHYFAVVGYNADKREVFIADSANFGGNQHYWLTLEQLATLIPPKGYSSLASQP